MPLRPHCPMVSPARPASNIGIPPLKNSQSGKSISPATQMAMSPGSLAMTPASDTTTPATEPRRRQPFQAFSILKTPLTPVSSAKSSVTRSLIPSPDGSVRSENCAAATLSLQTPKASPSSLVEYDTTKVYFDVKLHDGAKCVSAPPHSMDDDGARESQAPTELTVSSAIHTPVARSPSGHLLSSSLISTRWATHVGDQNTSAEQVGNAGAVCSSEDRSQLPRRQLFNSLGHEIDTVLNSYDHRKHRLDNASTVGGCHISVPPSRPLVHGRLLSRRTPLLRRTFLSWWERLRSSRRIRVCVRRRMWRLLRWYVASWRSAVNTVRICHSYGNLSDGQRAVWSAHHHKSKNFSLQRRALDGWRLVCCQMSKEDKDELLTQKLATKDAQIKELRTQLTRLLHEYARRTNTALRGQQQIPAATTTTTSTTIAIETPGKASIDSANAVGGLVTTHTASTTGDSLTAASVIDDENDTDAVRVKPASVVLT